MQPSSPIKSAGWKRPSKSKIQGKIVRWMIWNLSLKAPEAVRLQAGESSMQCFHCQSVCSGRDSWSPISQSIWELRQKVLSPVNTKKRRTEHCKGCVTEQAPHLCSVTLKLPGAGPVLEFIQINTSFKVTVPRSWLQPPGACVSSCRDVPRLPLQNTSAPWELLCPLQPKCKENQGCFLLSNSEIKTLQTVQWKASSRWDNKFWVGTLVLVLLVGKGCIFNPPFLLIMSCHYLMNLQLVILPALHSLQSQQKILNSWTPVQVTGFHASVHPNQWEFGCCA